MICTIVSITHTECNDNLDVLTFVGKLSGGLLQVEEIDVSQTMAANRPQRRAAAVKKPAYVEILSSDADDNEDTGSDFETSD